MKRLLSLLLVIATLFSICAVFSGCDGNSLFSKEKKRSVGVDLSMEGVTVEEAIVCSGHDLILTVKDVDTDEDSVIFHFTLENPAKRVGSITVESGYCVVNQLSAVSCTFSYSVESGETVNAKLKLPIEQLEILGITTIGQLDLMFTFYPNNNKSLENRFTCTVKTNKAGTRHTPPLQGKEICKVGATRVLLIDLVFNKKTGEKGMYVLLENTNAVRWTTYSIKDLQVNGHDLSQDDLYAAVPGKTHTAFFLDMSDATKFGVKTVDDIQEVRFVLSGPKYSQEILYIPGNTD